MYDAIVYANVHLRKIELKRAHVHFLKGEKPKVVKEELPDVDKKQINLDSLYIEGLNGFSIGKIELSDFNFDVIDLLQDSVTLEQKKLGLEIKGIALNKLSDTGEYFSLDLEDAVIELPKQKINLPGGYYALSFKLYLIQSLFLILEDILSLDLKNNLI